MSCLKQTIVSNAGPITWHVENLKIGSAVKYTWFVVDTNDNPIPISSDDSIITVIKKPNNDTLVTLQFNSGHNRVGENGFSFLLAAPLTDAAGDYTFETRWVRPATGENRPIIDGVFKVSG